MISSYRRCDLARPLQPSFDGSRRECVEGREVGGSAAAKSLRTQAEALLQLGRVVEARTAVDRALAMTASPDLSWWDAELHRIRAAVIRAEGGGIGSTDRSGGT